MTIPLRWRRPMLTVSVLLIVLIGFAVALFFSRERKAVAPAKATISIFDPRLNVLGAQMLKGSNTYYLPAYGNVLGGEGLGNRFEGKLRDQVHSLGVGVDTLPSFTPGKGLDGRAFLISYAFPDPPTSSMHLHAELVAQDGTVIPLKSKAGGGGPPERSWDLWTLDALPSAVTNYVLRLKAQTNGALVGEIRFEEL